MRHEDHLATVRRQLDELRRQIGVQKGDVLDHALVVVEALAVTMAAMSTDAAALVAQGERTVGAVVSAAMTKTALWRVVVLPAIVGALVSAMTFGVATTVQSFVAQRVIQADHDASAKTFEAALAATHQHFEELRVDLDRQQNEVEAERHQVETTLPGLLLKRAETLTGAAREIVHQEAATPGLIDFMARNGFAVVQAARLNGGSLCPLTVYQGPTRYCEYRIE